MAMLAGGVLAMTLLLRRHTSDESPSLPVSDERLIDPQANRASDLGEERTAAGESVASATSVDVARGLRGQVADERGAGVPAALVIWVDATHSSQFATEEGFLETMTQSTVRLPAPGSFRGGHATQSSGSGRFRFEVPPPGSTTNIVVWHREYGVVVQTVPVSAHTQQDLRIVLPRQSRVWGTVHFDSSGDPARDVQVSVSKQERKGRRGPVVVHPVDSHGAYETLPLPDGDYIVSARGEGLSPSPPRHVTLRGGRPMRIDFMLVSAHRVNITLLDPVGNAWTSERLEEHSGLALEHLEFFLTPEDCQRRSTLDRIPYYTLRPSKSSSLSLTGTTTNVGARYISAWRGTLCVGRAELTTIRQESVHIAFGGAGTRSRVTVRFSWRPTPQRIPTTKVTLADFIGVGEMFLSPIATAEATTGPLCVIRVPRAMVQGVFPLLIQSTGYATQLAYVCLGKRDVDMPVVLDRVVGDVRGFVADVEGRRLPAARVFLVDREGRFLRRPLESQWRGSRDGSFLIPSVGGGEQRVIVLVRGFAPKGFRLLARDEAHVVLRKGSIREIRTDVALLPGQFRVRDSNGQVIWNDRLRGIVRTRPECKIRIDESARTIELWQSTKVAPTASAQLHHGGARRLELRLR